MVARRGIILHGLVTPGDVAGGEPGLLDQLRRVRFRWKLRPERLIADTKYGRVRISAPWKNRESAPSCRCPIGTSPPPTYTAPPSPTTASGDVYVAPRDKRSGRIRPRRRRAERLPSRAATCNACPVKEQCTRSKQGRLIGRSFHAAYVERVRAYQTTAAYKKAVRKRSVWVEPLFAEAKQWHGLNRFRLRRLANVNIEALLVASGQNLKRWLQATGWGRRTLPGAAPAATLRASVYPSRREADHMKAS